MNTTTNPLGPPQGDVYLPTDISPEALFQAWSRQRREALIEMLIDTLDAADGDADLEPSLMGYSDGMDDREGDGCDDESTMDKEPSLGSLSSNGGCQTLWATGGCTDHEEDNDTGVADLDALHEQCLVSTYFQQVV